MRSTSKERKARNRLFSSSESDSSDSDDQTSSSTANTTDAHGRSRDAPAVRALSMAAGRSASAKTSSSSSASAPLGRTNGASSDSRRKTMTSAASFSVAGSSAHSARESANHSFIGTTTTGSSGSLFPERKGLFEQDDESESIERLHEQAKLRQRKKQSEIESLKSELERALERVAELETAAGESQRAKDEYEIRMKECYRIIEKRNKQLMKASERVARYSEQAESQLTELQSQVTALTTQCEQLRARDASQSDALAAVAKDRERLDAALQEQQRAFDERVERVTQLANESVRTKQAEADALARHVRELEAAAASRVREHDEAYQTLLKRCEDAEAIGRGLKFQLEKEQQEKKFLKNQLASLQAPSDFAATGARGHDDLLSPTSSVASAADLASFDYARASMLESPVRAAPKSPTRRRSDVGPPTMAFEAKAASVEAPSDAPSPVQRVAKPRDEPPTAAASPAPAAAAVDEKPAPTLARPGSASTNFFEKLSIKFKRSSSPRNSATAARSESQTFPTAASTTPPGATSGASFTSASSVPDPAPAPVRGTSRRERPRMYVAKAPSTYDEESSDSIFGSESDSEHSVSESDDEQPPLPPPPPPEDSVLRPAAPAVGATTTAQPSLFASRQVSGSGRSVDAVEFSSSSNSSDDSDDEVDGNADAAPRRHVDEPLPTPAPRNKTDAKSAPSNESSSSSDSDDASEAFVRRTSIDSKRTRHASVPAPRAATVDAGEESDVSSSSSSESSSSSSDTEIDTARHRRHRHRAHNDDSESRKHASSSKQRSSSLPRTKREKSHSTGDDSGHTSKSRMNEYMEARAKKRLEKLKKKEEREHAEHRKKEEYEKEWEKMAQEERERKRKQQQVRRGARRRPSSLKTVRVSQMKQHLNKQKEHEQQTQQSSRTDESAAAGGDIDERPRRQSSRRKSESRLSDSDDDANDAAVKPPITASDAPPTTPLPPEPTEADTELYLRQQARLRERHEMELKKKIEADEADLVRGQIHRRVEMWAFGKELLHLILTLDQISTSDALQKCQLAVIQSPDNETVRKAYRYVKGLLVSAVVERARESLTVSPRLSCE